MLICVSFGIRKVRRLLYFGSSLFALCSMPIHPIYTYISTLKSFWFEKHDISPPESDWEIPDSKEHKTHVTMHILSRYWWNPSRFHQAGRQAVAEAGAVLLQPTRADMKACTASPAGWHPEEHVQTHTNTCTLWHQKLGGGVGRGVPLSDSLHHALFWNHHSDSSFSDSLNMLLLRSQRASMYKGHVSC